MRTVVVGLGVQGAKRIGVAGDDLVATVDPIVPEADSKSIQYVPLDSYDAAILCTPDQVKLELLDYLLSRGKHVLVEKPLLFPDVEQLHRLEELANSTGAACYTAYNHRFEPHLVRVKELLDTGILGEIYLVRMFYGNGTALDVKRSPWRNEGTGVVQDIGSHLLDSILFFFGPEERKFEAWSLSKFENPSFDHALFGSPGQPLVELEATLLSWKNNFQLDVLGELGSAHVSGLCKWGPSTFTVRKRVFPSGVPEEQVQTIECPDPTWELEYEHFKELCSKGATNLENDRWINSALIEIDRSATVGQIR